MRTIILLALIALAKAQLDGCETLTLPAHQALDLQKFAGSWYVLKVGTRLASQQTPIDVTCHESVISPAGNNLINFQDRYNLIENGTVTGPATADYDVYTGEINVNDPNPAIWSIHLDGGDKSLGQSLIIASDHVSWTLEYACFLHDGLPIGKLSFWSRHRYMEPLVEKTLNDVATSLGFPLNNFLHVEHSQC